MTAPRVMVVMPLAEQLGGGEMMFRHLLQYGGAQGVEWIVVFTQDGPMVAESRARGYETHVIAGGRMRELGRRWRASSAMAALARQRGVALILGWMVASVPLAGLAAWRAKIPFIWYQVGFPAPDWLDRVATLMPARGIFVLSRDCEAAQARVWPSRPLTLIYPGAELERFEKASAVPMMETRSALGLPTDRPLIGIIGRLQRWKGMHVLIEALPRIRARHPLAEVVVVGGAHALEPQYREELERLVAQLELGSSVRFAGFQTDIPAWMQAMDVLVHASDREPFGIVVVEAMAVRKPLVAGDRGGPAEVITPGVDGLLAPYGDAGALAESILRYLDDPGFAAEVAGAAQRRAREFSAGRFARAVVTAVLRHVGEDQR